MSALAEAVAHTTPMQDHNLAPRRRATPAPPDQLSLALACGGFAEPAVGCRGHTALTVTGEGWRPPRFVMGHPGRVSARAAQEEAERGLCSLMP